MRGLRLCTVLVTGLADCGDWLWLLCQLLCVTSEAELPRARRPATRIGHRGKEAQAASGGLFTPSLLRYPVPVLAANRPRTQLWRVKPSVLVTLCQRGLPSQEPRLLVGVCKSQRLSRLERAA